MRLSLHSALKEFFEPLRFNDPRADFFAVYRKEADEFDRDWEEVRRGSQHVSHLRERVHPNTLVRR